jgi:hypothetical protein
MYSSSSPRVTTRQRGSAGSACWSSAKRSIRTKNRRMQLSQTRSSSPTAVDRGKFAAHDAVDDDDSAGHRAADASRDAQHAPQCRLSQARLKFMPPRVAQVEQRTSCRIEVPVREMSSLRFVSRLPPL